MADVTTRITATIEGVGTPSFQPVVKLMQGSGQRDETAMHLRGLTDIRHVRDALTRVIQASEKLGPDQETVDAYYKK